MPTDENNWVVSQNQNPQFGSNQNQQVNPSVFWGQANQNIWGTSSSWTTDDFDFNFNVENWNVNNWIENQSRTGMFLTQDEELQANEIKNSWQSNSFQSEKFLGDTQGVSADTGFINVNSNADSNMDNDADRIRNIDNANDQDRQIDDKIEDLISFHDDWPSNINESPLVDEKTDEKEGVWNVSNDDMLWNSFQQDSDVNNQENTDNLTMNEQDWQDVLDSSPSESLNDSQNDDWLQQEDKKVEEVFGPQDDNQNVVANDSSDNMVQNVEDLFNDTGDNNLNWDSFWQNKNLDEKENNSGIKENNQGNDVDLSGSLWSENQQSNNYVPNEDDYATMSNLLNSSSSWQVDLTSIDNNPQKDLNSIDDSSLGLDPISNSQQQVNNDVLYTDNSENNIDYQQNVQMNSNNQQTIVNGNTENSIQWDFNTQFDNTGVSFTENQEIWNNQKIDSNTVWSNFENNIDYQQNVQMDFDNQQTISDGNAENSVQWNLNNQFDNTGVSFTKNQEIWNNQEIDLNTVWSVWWPDLWNVDNNTFNNQWWVPLDTILNQEIQDMHIDPQSNNNIQQNMDSSTFQNQNTMNMTKKRKKQSWIIVLIVIAVICVLMFVAMKMFPDNKIVKIFKWNNAEYSAWSENVDEWKIDEGNLGDWEQWVDDQVDDTWLWEEIDPNSIAALLSGDDEMTWIDNSWDIENSWETILPEDEVFDTWTVSEDFDPYWQISDILDEGKSDVDRLNDYISQWNYYKDLWKERGSKSIEKYGEYIIVLATTELWKLENWEEIDSNVFNKLDGVLEVVQWL